MTLDELEFETQSLVFHVNLPLESSLEVYVIVEGTLDLPSNTIATVTGEIDFYGDEVAFNGTSYDSWTSVLDSDQINIYKLTLNSSQSVANFSDLVIDASGLIIFGSSCFDTDSNGTDDFQSTQCTYGRVCLNLDSSDESLILIEGQFTNLTQEQIMYGMAGLDATFINESVTSVLSLVDLEDLILYNFTATTTQETSNSTSNSTESSEVSNSTNESSSNPTDLITLVANGSIAEVPGVIQVTIYPVDNTLIEVISFQSADVAYGNIEIFSNDTANPNTVTITISEDTSSDQQVEVVIQNITIFDYSATATVNLEDDSISLSGTLTPNSSLIFTVEGSGTYTDTFNGSDLVLSIALDNRYELFGI